MSGQLYTCTFLNVWTDKLLVGNNKVEQWQQIMHQIFLVAYKTPQKTLVPGNTSKVLNYFSCFKTTTKKSDNFLNGLTSDEHKRNDSKL